MYSYGYIYVCVSHNVCVCVCVCVLDTRTRAHSSCVMSLSVVKIQSNFIFANDLVLYFASPTLAAAATVFIYKKNTILLLQM